MNTDSIPAKPLERARADASSDEQLNQAQSPSYSLRFRYEPEETASVDDLLCDADLLLGSGLAVFITGGADAGCPLVVRGGLRLITQANHLIQALKVVRQQPERFEAPCSAMRMTYRLAGEARAIDLAYDAQSFMWAGFGAVMSHGEFMETLGDIEWAGIYLLQQAEAIVDRLVDVMVEST